MTMGLKKGHTVLLHFQVQGIQYQAILMMVDSVPGSKGGDYQHNLWKHVLPRQTEFAWLPPDFADAFCHTALQADPTRKYGIVDDFLDIPNWKANITLEQMYLIGDSRSAHELEVFINMPIQRLRVGCGLQCTLPHLPLGPSSRPQLFSAAVKLLRFALCSYSTRATNSAEEALWRALYPLLWNPDEHVMATLAAVVFGLLWCLP